MAKSKTAYPVVNSTDIAPLSVATSDLAPVIFFENITTQGINLGVGGMCLETMRHTLSASGTIVSERIVVAHLRFPLPVLDVIKNSIDQIALLSKPTASIQKN